MTVNARDSLYFLLAHGRTVNDYFSDTKTDLAQILAEGIDNDATAEPTFEVRRTSERGEDGGDEFALALGTTIRTRKGHSIPFVYELVEGQKMSQLIFQAIEAGKIGLTGLHRRLDSL